MLRDSIIQAVQRARSAAIVNEIVADHPEVKGANEFLFFVKPELLWDDPALQIEAVLAMILEKIETFGLHIRSARVLSAGYLEKHGIIAQHYGVINQIATDAKTHLSEAGKARFESIFGEPFAQATVLGGLEILDRYPAFTAQALDYLWQNVKFEKLAGGTYALRLKIDGTPLYLINGFHARQLQHFTEAGRCIVVLSLVGELDWAKARTALIGATCPADAVPGSIRRELLEQADALGLQAVTPSWNGVHLSAGPIEGLIELIRYQSDFGAGRTLSAGDFALGRQLLDRFGPETTAWILENPEVTTAEGTISIFDRTEEQNASDALEALSAVMSSRSA